MKRGIKWCIITLVVTLISCSKSDEDVISSEEQVLRTEIKKIQDNFITELNALGFNTPNVPAIKIENTPSLVFFGGTSITVPIWETLNEQNKDLFNDWAETANAGFTGEEFFRKTFNWFLVIHELGHYVQQVKNTTKDDYGFEVEANEIAIAYWKINNREALDAYITILTQVFATLPVPQNTSRTYFNSNYETIGDNPEVYGYFQFKFIIEAYNVIDSLELNTYL